jgi:hypothetical protein
MLPDRDTLQRNIDAHTLGVLLRTANAVAATGRERIAASTLIRKIAVKWSLTPADYAEFIGTH